MAAFEALTVPLIVWIVAVVVFSGVVQGALGLGFPTLATPLIAVVTDIRTAVIIVLLPCLATVAAGLVINSSLRQAFAAFWPMPIYMLIGAAVGTRIFIAFPDVPYALVLAGLIVVYLNLERFGKAQWQPVRRNPRSFGAVFGLAAGLTEGTANVAAPALVAYYLAIAVQPTLLVQALNICFFTGKLTQFVTLASVGGVTAAEWALTLPLALLATAGAVYGTRIRGRIDAPTYRKWLRGALWVIAGLLVAQYAFDAATT